MQAEDSHKPAVPVDRKKVCSILAPPLGGSKPLLLVIGMGKGGNSGAIAKLVKDSLASKQPFTPYAARRVAVSTS